MTYCYFHINNSVVTYIALLTLHDTCITISKVMLSAGEGGHPVALDGVSECVARSSTKAIPASVSGSANEQKLAIQETHCKVTLLSVKFH
jgi:hypothetical protein